MRLFGFDIDVRRTKTPADLMLEVERERRSQTIGPFTATDKRSRDVFSGSMTSSGVYVTEAGSLSISAVYAAVRVLAESVSSLPLKLYRRDGRNRAPAPDHPLYSVLQRQGNNLMTAMKAREVAMLHLLLWGNAFLEIQRNGRGDVVGLWPIHPGRVVVSVKIVDGQPTLSYDVQNTKKGSTPMGPEDILLIAGLGTDYLGKSPIQLHREGLGIEISARRYGAKFFSNDARPGLVLEHPGVMGDEAFENFMTSWTAVHQGSNNAHRVAILEEGMKASVVGLPPDDAQFIETRKYGRSEVASIFRVPPHMIGDLERATFSNIEHQSIEFVVHSLRPWLVRIEQAITSQLLSEDEQGEYYVRHMVDGLLRGDTQSRYDAYTKARNWGWMSANDIRELEDQNPVDGGDVYLQPLNMVPAGTDPFADDTGTSARAALPPARGIERRAAPPRVKSASALQAVYLDTFRRIVTREIVEIRRAVTTYLEAGDIEGFRAWVVEFADKQAGWMTPRMLPIFQAMAEAMIEAAATEIGSDVTAGDMQQFVQDYSEASASRYVSASRGQLLGLLVEEGPMEAVEARLDEWGDTRADKEARRARERSSNAMTNAIWVLAGITAVTWRTTNEACPICNEMEGRTTLMSVPFLQSGENVAGLVTSGRVGHPPLHDGCDCYLEPSIRSGHRAPERRSAEILAAIIEHTKTEIGLSHAEKENP